MRVLLFLILVFFVELAGFVAFAESFGFWALVFEILASGLLGVLLLLSILSGSNESLLEILREARDPKEVVASNLLRILGAILLIIPGILSDCLGLLLQFGVLDAWALSGFGRWRRSEKDEGRSECVIDVEILEDGRDEGRRR